MTRSVRLPACTLAILAVPGFAGNTAKADTPVSKTTSAPQTTPAPSSTQTPAQQKYGLPKNPILGGMADTDLSRPLSLDRAIQIGLQRQNSIAIQRAGADAASARLTQSRSSYYPQINPSYRYTYNLQPGGAFFAGGNLIQGGSSVQENTNTSISISQTLFDAGRREANVGLSRRSLFAAEYSVGNQRQIVILNVTESYYNLLRTKELVRVQEENVRRAQTTLESIQAQAAVGNAAKSDTFQSESDLANAQVQLLLAQNNYNIAQAQLKNDMGVISPLPVTVPEDKISTPRATPDLLGLEEYVRAAYSDRLDVKQQQERVNAQGYSLRLAHINNGFDVQANISQGYADNPIVGELRTFTVSVTYPLFDGFLTRSAVRESKANLETERRTLDQIQQNVRLEVEQAYLTREQTRRSIAAAQTAVQAGEINYNAALERQRNGLINILDVLNAQVQLVNAQVSLVNSIYDFYIAEARLRRSVGANDPIYTPRVPGAKMPLSLGTLFPKSLTPSSNAPTAATPVAAVEGRKP